MWFVGNVIAMEWSPSQLFPAPCWKCLLQMAKGLGLPCFLCNKTLQKIIVSDWYSALNTWTQLIVTVSDWFFLSLIHLWISSFVLMKVESTHKSFCLWCFVCQLAQLKISIFDIENCKCHDTVLLLFPPKGTAQSSFVIFTMATITCKAKYIRSILKFKISCSFARLA